MLNCTIMHNFQSFRFIILETINQKPQRHIVYWPNIKQLIKVPANYIRCVEEFQKPYFTSITIKTQSRTVMSESLIQEGGPKSLKAPVRNWDMIYVAPLKL